MAAPPPALAGGGRRRAPAASAGSALHVAGERLSACRPAHHARPPMMQTSQTTPRSCSGRLPSHRGSLDAGAPCFAPPPGGGGASGGLGRSASLPSPYDVAELLARISLLAPPAPPPAGPSAGGPRALAADGSRLHWVQPSGACAVQVWRGVHVPPAGAASGRSWARSRLAMTCLPMPAAALPPQPNLHPRCRPAPLRAGHRGCGARRGGGGAHAHRVRACGSGCGLVCAARRAALRVPRSRIVAGSCRQRRHANRCHLHAGASRSMPAAAPRCASRCWPPGSSWVRLGGRRAGRQAGPCGETMPGASARLLPTFTHPTPWSLTPTPPPTPARPQRRLRARGVPRERVRHQVVDRGARRALPPRQPRVQVCVCGCGWGAWHTCLGHGAGATWDGTRPAAGWGAEGRRRA